MLSLSNDSEEGRYLLKALEGAFDAYGLGPEASRKLFDIVGSMQSNYFGIGFCLSSVPDRLSQWRGYARECTGFSVGFDKTALGRIACEINKSFYLTATFDEVVYDKDRQRIIAAEDAALIKKYIIDNIDGTMYPTGDDAISEYVKLDRAAQSSSTMMRAIHAATQRMYFLKNPSFFEEHEWRICSLISSAMLGRLSFCVSRDVIVPYRDHSFDAIDGRVIKSIYMGSRNRTPIDVVEALLQKHGFEHVNIYQSEASFR